MVKVEGGGEEEVSTDTWERGASHLVAGASECLGRRRDRSVDDRHEDVEERHGSEHLARDVEALGVLLDDEDQGADHEQKGQNLQDSAKHAARLGIRLHFVPVDAGADVGAVALVEACAPGGVGGGCREAGAGAGCADRRVQQGRSDRRVQSDRQGQLTVNVVAFAVRVRGAGAKGRGLLDASGLPREVHTEENDHQECVEAGANHRAHVESAAAATAFDVRRHAHGEACACNGRIGSAMCYNCGRWGGEGGSTHGNRSLAPFCTNGGGLISQSRFVGR